MSRKTMSTKRVAAAAVGVGVTLATLTGATTAFGSPTPRPNIVVPGGGVSVVSGAAISFPAQTLDGNTSLAVPGLTINDPGKIAGGATVTLTLSGQSGTANDTNNTGVVVRHQPPAHRHRLRLRRHRLQAQGHRHHGHLHGRQDRRLDGRELPAVGRLSDRRRRDHVTTGQVDATVSYNNATNTTTESGTKVRSFPFGAVTPASSPSRGREDRRRHRRHAVPRRVPGYRHRHQRQRQQRQRHLPGAGHRLRPAGRRVRQLPRLRARHRDRADGPQHAVARGQRHPQRLQQHRHGVRARWYRRHQRERRQQPGEAGRQRRPARRGHRVRDEQDGRQLRQRPRRRGRRWQRQRPQEHPGRDRLLGHEVQHHLRVVVPDHHRRWQPGHREDRHRRLRRPEQLRRRDRQRAGVLQGRHPAVSDHHGVAGQRRPPAAHQRQLHPGHPAGRPGGGVQRRVRPADDHDRQGRGGRHRVPHRRCHRGRDRSPAGLLRDPDEHRRDPAGRSGLPADRPGQRRPHPGRRAHRPRHGLPGRPGRRPVRR